MVFFCFLLIVSCQKTVDAIVVSVNYKNDKAVSISFISDISSNDFSVHLKDNKTAVLGDFSLDKGAHTFTPIIPFSGGQEYQLNHLDKTMASFIAENNTITEIPELAAIYPTTDTVPENMLKMYFVFSKPMQEVGKSLDFIKVFNKITNKEVEVFLELETELWNREHTILTLWLDPGRIKTDLIPNKEKGLPILESNEYIITIDNNWKDAGGNTLKQEYSKNLYVIKRDAKNPSVNDWEITIPKKETTNPLIIDFKESLDAILAQETIQIYNAENELVLGELRLKNNEQILEFESIGNWHKGNYFIIVESRLEDLAGNNLNHLFDVDLENNTSHEVQTETKTIQFTIP